jgi:hypothetical protein
MSSEAAPEVVDGAGQVRLIVFDRNHGGGAALTTGRFGSIMAGIFPSAFRRQSIAAGLCEVWFKRWLEKGDGLAATGSL